MSNQSIIAEENLFHDIKVCIQPLCRNSFPDYRRVNRERSSATHVSRNSVPGLLKVENAELRSAAQNAERSSATLKIG
jgi:phenylalanine-4-hydroxylase